MTTGGLIGSGHIGSTVARLAVAAGHDDGSSTSSELLQAPLPQSHVVKAFNDTVDLGPLSEGWRVQPGTAAYGTPYAADSRAWDQGAEPAPAAVVEAAAAAATRS